MPEISNFSLINTVNDSLGYFIIHVSRQLEGMKAFKIYIIHFKNPPKGEYVKYLNR